MDESKRGPESETARIRELIANDALRDGQFTNLAETRVQLKPHFKCCKLFEEGLSCHMQVE
jgi:hypothetical protein